LTFSGKFFAIKSEQFQFMFRNGCLAIALALPLVEPFTWTMLRSLAVLFKVVAAPTVLVAPY